MDQIDIDDKLSDNFPYLNNITVGGSDQAEHDCNVKRLVEALRKRNLSFNGSKMILSVFEVNIIGYYVGKAKIKPDPDRLKLLKELPPHNMRSFKRDLGLHYARWIPNVSDKIQSLKVTKHFPLNQNKLQDF